jgi:phage terminase large subunit-like protein
LLYPLWLFGAIKKSRKTELAALLTVTVISLFGGRHAEAFICANTHEQAIARCFSGCKLICEASPLLKNETVSTQDKICFLSTQSTIFAIPNEPADRNCVGVLPVHRLNAWLKALVS